MGSWILGLIYLWGKFGLGKLGSGQIWLGANLGLGKLEAGLGKLGSGAKVAGQTRKLGPCKGPGTLSKSG